VVEPSWQWYVVIWAWLGLGVLVVTMTGFAVHALIQDFREARA
jgi:hypothetical protein